MADRLRNLCVIFTVTLLLFFVINLVALFISPRDTSQVLHQHPVFDPKYQQTLEQIYNLPIAEIREIVKESYMEDAWIYEPYVQFRERPREGRFVTVSELGFRANATLVSTFAPTSESIFLFGGSTMFGYGVRDEDTIANHLESALREKPEFESVTVYNFGRGYYGLRQELLLFQSLVQRQIIPRIAVFLDGVNEHLSFCPVYSVNVAEMFRLAQHDPMAKISSIVAGLPVMRLLQPSHRSAIEANIMYRIKSKRPFPFPFECKAPEDVPFNVALSKNYMLNRDLIRAIAQKYDIETLFIVQPVPGYKNNNTVDPYGKPFIESGSRIALLENTVSEPDEVSFAGILQDYTLPAFVDKIHYSAGANRHIARGIARQLEERMATELR